MKTVSISIGLINSSINLKCQNGKNDFNFYHWLKEAQKNFRSDLSLKQLWVKICYANCTEKTCKNYFETSCN